MFHVFGDKSSSAVFAVVSLFCSICCFSFSFLYHCVCFAIGAGYLHLIHHRQYGSPPGCTQSNNTNSNYFIFSINKNWKRCWRTHVVVFACFFVEKRSGLIIRCFSGCPVFLSSSCVMMLMISLSNFLNEVTNLFVVFNV